MRNVATKCQQCDYWRVLSCEAVIDDIASGNCNCMETGLICSRESTATTCGIMTANLWKPAFYLKMTSFFTYIVTPFKLFV